MTGPEAPREARIGIVEDHPLFQQTLATTLSSMEGLSLVAVSSSGQEILAALADVRVDILLVDLSLPDQNGIDVISDVTRLWPDVRCLILSGLAEARYVDKAYAAGARGYVLKGSPRELRAAIDAVLVGSIYLSEALRER